MYPKAELLFPPRLVASLRNLRGPGWAALVDRVTRIAETEPDSLAFTLLMIRLNSCVKCHEGSFKYMRGCQLCAAQSVMQYKGDDDALVAQYQKAREDVDAYIRGEFVEDIVEEETETEE
ncbi:MAG TPA: hypothetical protein VGA61_19280 [Anaerolineae bacterium]